MSLGNKIIRNDISREANLKRSLEVFLDTVTFIAIIDILWMILYISYYDTFIAFIHVIMSSYLLFNIYKVRLKEDRFKNIKIIIYILSILVIFSIVNGEYIDLIKLIYLLYVLKIFDEAYKSFTRLTNEDYLKIYFPKKFDFKEQFKILFSNLNMKTLFFWVLSLIVLYLSIGALPAIIYERFFIQHKGFRLETFIFVPALIIYFYNIGLRYKKLSVNESVNLTRQPPVLLLRSFKDDNYYIKQPAVPYFWNYFVYMNPFIASILGTKDLERIIAENLQNNALITIGNPDEKLPPYGASREYISNDSWKHSVETFLNISKLTIILVGGTHGVSWEIREIKQRDEFARTLFIIPPFTNDNNYYSRIKKLFNILEIKVNESELYEKFSYENATMVYIQDGFIIVFSAYGHYQNSYESVLIYALNTIDAFIKKESSDLIYYEKLYNIFGTFKFSTELVETFKRASSLASTVTKDILLQALKNEKLEIKENFEFLIDDNLIDELKKINLKDNKVISNTVLAEFFKIKISKQDKENKKIQFIEYGNDTNAVKYLRRAYQAWNQKALANCSSIFEDETIQFDEEGFIDKYLAIFKDIIYEKITNIFIPLKDEFLVSFGNEVKGFLLTNKRFIVFDFNNKIFQEIYINDIKDYNKVKEQIMINGQMIQIDSLQVLPEIDMMKCLISGKKSSYLINRFSFLEIVTPFIATFFKLSIIVFIPYLIVYLMSDKLTFLEFCLLVLAYPIGGFVAALPVYFFQYMRKYTWSTYLLGVLSGITGTNVFIYLTNRIFQFSKGDIVSDIIVSSLMGTFYGIVFTFYIKSNKFSKSKLR